MGEDRLKPKRQVANWDAAALLKLMWESWNDVFRKTLGPAERSLLSELRDQRNKWAHQQTFSSDDAYRALDSAGRSSPPSQTQQLHAHAADDADAFAEIDLRMARRMGQRHEDFARPAAGDPNVILHDRIAAA